MEIGQRLRQARLEKGLSQRQLCEGLITRNMLSQIENGSARPSMEVLCTLAARLEKPVSFFLEEQVMASANQAVMAEAKEAFIREDWASALATLERYRRPDGVFDGEMGLLGVLCCLGLTEQALKEDKRPYCLQLLEQCAGFGKMTPYYAPALQRQRQWLLAKLSKEQALPDLDEALLLLAQRTMEENPVRAAALLDGVENKHDAQWYLLRGQAAFGMEAYQEAAAYFHKAEAAFPEETARKLEICYRELEDYKQAYYYATKKSGT